MSKLRLNRVGNSRRITVLRKQTSLGCACRRHHRPPGVGLLGGRGDVQRSASVKSTQHRIQSCGVDASFFNWCRGFQARH